jgi:hypothetical protein
VTIQWLEETFAEQVRVETDRVEYTRYFQAYADALEDGEQELLQFAPDLAQYQPHPRNSAALVRRFQPERDAAASGLWNLQVEYSTTVLPVEENPFAQPPRIRGASQIQRVPTFYDGQGKLITNTAGEVFTDPPLETEEIWWVYSFEKNVPVNLPAWLDDYPGATNSDAVRFKGRTRPKDTLKLTAMQFGDPQFAGEDGQIEFLVLSFELTYRRDGWIVRVPNVGYNELIEILPPLLNAGTKTLKQITFGKSQEKPEQPVFLDRKGRAYRVPLRDADDQIVLDEDGRPVPDPRGNLRTQLEPDEILTVEVAPRRLPFSKLPLK